MATNNSVVAGTTGQFIATAQPAGSAPSPSQPKPVWSASDPSVVLSPGPDGLEVAAAVPAGFTGASFALSINYVRTDGANASGSVTVTVTQPAPPEPTSFSIAQTS